jgi:hypothetical protein
LQQFYCHLPTKLRVVGEIDFAHAAHAEQRTDLITTKLGIGRKSNLLTWGKSDWDERRKNVILNYVKSRNETGSAVVALGKDCVTIGYWRPKALRVGTR